LVQSSTPGVLEFTRTRPLPVLLPDQVLVHVAAVALNPCDWKMPTNFPCPGAGVGSDFSGTIIQVGQRVSLDTYGVKVGDRVAGAAHASNRLEPQGGAFAEYIAAYADQIWRIPDGIGFPQAAAIGLCVTGTVGLAAFHERHLALPGSPERPFDQGNDKTKKPWVLVYGGSTASGTMAIQLLKL
jgi:NADPH:quinone reductase-like Zn-dependent oxidoreductase